MTNSPIDKAVKRAALYAGAFVVLVSALGMLNKWFIADPITSATSKIERAVDAQAKALGEESVARRTADQEIISLVQGLRGGQATIASNIAAATYSRAQIDDMKAAADVEHRALRGMVESLGAEVTRLRAARGRP